MCPTCDTYLAPLQLPIFIILQIKLPDWPRTAKEGQESQHKEQPQTDTGTREFTHLSDVEVSVDTSLKGVLNL